MDYKQNDIVSHETIEPYFICWNNRGRDELRRIYSDDDTGEIFLEVTTPACNNYSPFESTCISDCTWCDNPYHCKFNKNVPRETFMTVHELPLFIIVMDVCWNCFDRIGCDVTCKHDVSDMMTRLSISMIQGGLY